MFICSVPDELIEKFFDQLLPSICDIETLRYPLSKGDVSDLSQCRLVCRMFHHVASRLLWRRIELVLPGYMTSSPSTTTFMAAYLSRLSQITSFLAGNAEFRECVRFLSITTSGPNIPEAVARTTTFHLSSVTPHLINLRVLSLYGVSILPTRLTISLFLLPSLHTVRLGEIDFSSLSVEGNLMNTNIKQLGVYRCRQPQRLYAMMPSLRAFDGEVEGDTFAAITSWRSLEEVSFQVDLPGWDRAARNFSAWGRSRRNLPLSLTELMVCQWHFNPKIRNLDSVIEPFAGNPLKKLIVFYIEEPTPLQFERITHVFPTLRELSILSDEELAHWPSDLSIYGQTLSHIRNLQLLEWNYYDGADHDVYGSWDMINEERLVEITLSLAQACATLRKVNFCLFIDGLIGFAITRDMEGSPKVTTAEYSESWVHCTSAWKKERFTDV
ncbi:hypothetical protein K439DRAFT_1659806 [Ramaria rubella]|nr:hypothetical protein K439DRAFT_1659806 [Ramaria rubella]